MIDSENSVARLRSLAEKLSVHRDNLTPGVLADALGAAHNSSEFYWRVGLLVDLAKLARKQVDELEGERQAMSSMWKPLTALSAAWRSSI